jgi:hypothetical protein
LVATRFDFTRLHFSCIKHRDTFFSFCSQAKGLFIRSNGPGKRGKRVSETMRRARE